jgi:hypothetical protein
MKRLKSLRLLLNPEPEVERKQQPLTSSRSVNAPLRADGTIDKSEVIEIDAGDVDPRLEGCGTLPPAVLSCLNFMEGWSCRPQNCWEVSKEGSAVLFDSLTILMMISTGITWPSGAIRFW